MAVSLHGLRWKIAAAAIVKGAAWRLTKLPGGAGLVSRTASRLTPDGEASDSYRGLLGQLLGDAAEDVEDAASTAETAGQGLRYDAVAGLVPGAPELLPDLEMMQAEVDQNPSAGGLNILAAAYRKPYVAQFEQANALYEQACALNPKDLRAVEGILTTGARTHFDWPRIWACVSALKPTQGPLGAAHVWDTVEPLFDQRPESSAVLRAARELRNQQRQVIRVHQLLLEAIIVRLQMLGQFRAALLLRRLMAENRLRELGGIPLESTLWLKHLLGAHAYLGNTAEVQKKAGRPPLDITSRRVATQVEKLQADAALCTGDERPLIEHARRRRRAAPMTGDERMTELVTGRRVAVVGPAASQEQLGEVIDGYDVVVRTRFAPGFVAAHAQRIGSRTDIAYYSGRDLTDVYDDVDTAVRQGQLQLAVTRPFFAVALEDSPEWLRFARFEYGLYFRGAPLGIQRIVYDLLQFEPEEIGIFHADFYAGRAAVAEGYRGSSGTFGPYAQLNDVVVVHDLFYEFECLQRFLGSGRVTAHGTAAEVLALDVVSYALRLEKGPLGG